MARWAEAEAPFREGLAAYEGGVGPDSPDLLDTIEGYAAVLDQLGRADEAEALYQRHIKGVYGDLLSFMGRLELPLDEAHRQFWLAAQLAALQRNTPLP